MAERVTGQRDRGAASWHRWLWLLLVVAGLFVAFKLLPVADWLQALKDLVRGQGALGYVIFVAAYVVVALIPGGPALGMTLAAGALFGVAVGTVVVSGASTLAALVAFLLARTLLHGKIERWTRDDPRFARLSAAVEKRGPRIVALVRLSPLFPFTVVNYAFGVMPVKVGPYVLTSWLAMLPGTLAYVYLGAAVGDAAGGGSVTGKGIKLGLAALGVGATVWAARLVKKSMDEVAPGTEEMR
jgi:uncharacterized membrane protein YdjX (TVP38/TMEM64 family)